MTTQSPASRWTRRRRRIRAWPDQGIDRVEVWLGEKTNPSSIFLGLADLGFSDSTAASNGPQFANAGWRLVFKPTRIHAHTYIMWAYAHSAVTGNEDSAQRLFQISES